MGFRKLSQTNRFLLIPESETTKPQINRKDRIEGLTVRQAGSIFCNIFFSERAKSRKRFTMLFPLRTIKIHLNGKPAGGGSIIAVHKVKWVFLPKISALCKSSLFDLVTPPPKKNKSSQIHHWNSAFGDGDVSRVLRRRNRHQLENKHWKKNNLIWS